MKIKNHLFFLILLLHISLYAQENKFIVKDIAAYNDAIKKALPGTNIILKNGIWKDVHLKAYGNGVKENPIVIKAETPGKVIISGDSKLQIYGTYIVVQGLWFKDGNPKAKSIVSFKKNSKELANNCRFTHNTISYYNPEDGSLKTHWVDLWGKNNRVDHNNFTGKTNDGTTLVVWLKGEQSDENNHLIDANFFGPRPELGKNGGETIRIGTSTNSMKSSKTIVENNTFKNCDGEIEIISNKSCDNIYRNNLFLASKGALTLRHGNNALVEKNVFIGNNVSKTGGIRIINEGHIVRNNLLIGLNGKGNRAPIVVMNGVPNSPLNRYNQVKNVSIQNNTLINCGTIEFAADKDAEKTLPPITTLFANNLISNTNGAKISNASDDISGIIFKNNIAETTGIIDEALFSKQTIDWKVLRTIPVPTGKNEKLISNFTNTKTPKVDIVGAQRTAFVVGAFNLESTKYPRALTIKTGPYWKPLIIAPKVIIKPKVVTVVPGIGTLAKAIKKATAKTTFILKDGVYFMEKEQKINGDISIIGSKNTQIQASKEVEKSFKSFFKIKEKATLNLQNLSFDGSIKNMKYAIISPSENEAAFYNLFIDNCSFTNFKDKKGAIIKSYTNTTADTIRIKNSVFTNSFRGLNFHSKNNSIGTLNAQHLLIENTVFKNITEFAIKYIKAGAFINPSLGDLKISNCIFSKIDNREKGKIITVKDIAFSEIKNSVFENSYNIVTPVNLSGSGNTINNCLVSSCGAIKVSKGAIKKNIHYKSPKWEDKKNFVPSAKSYLFKENNKIATIGLLK